MNKTFCLFAFFVQFLLLLCSCISQNRTNVDGEDTLEVECRIYYVFDNFMEDSLIQKESYTIDRYVYLHMRITNMSSQKKYVPLAELDSMYKSHIAIYLNDIDISLYSMYEDNRHRILAPHDTTFIRIVAGGSKLEKAGVCKNIPLTDLLDKIQIRYYRDDKDTVLSKYQISDMEIQWDKNLIIEYQDPENVHEYF